jgi:hypothetical protein
MKFHIVHINHAKTMWDWMQNRGGLAIWKSINLSNPGASWTTPVLDQDGKPYGKPTWQADNEPSRIITDPDEVIVTRDEEVSRLRVSLRRSSNGLMIKCTDTSSARIRKAVERAGEKAYYIFDYETQEAVIMAPVDQFSLTQWYKYFSKEENHDSPRVA